MGLHPISSNRSGGKARSASRRRAAVSSNSASTSSPGVPRRCSIHGSFISPIGFFTYSGTSSSGGGAGSPSSDRSMARRCDTWSRTDHPGQSVGNAHCSGVSPRQAATADDHTSASWPMTTSSLAMAQPGSAASIASTTSGASGSTVGRNRFTISPPGDTRNFSKFHCTSPASPSPSGTAVSSS